MSRDALIVGINQYPQNLLRSFSAPANDAEGVAQVLAEYGDFLVRRLPETCTEPYQVCGKTEVKSGEMKRAIAQLLNPQGKQIPYTALLYFSGHGWQDSQGDTVDCYLATSDIDPDEDKFGVSFDWLKKQLEQSKVRQQIVILDCCNSGDLLNFETVTSAKKVEGQVRYFITACRDIEPAYTAADGVYSIFTKSLIDGLDPSRMPNGKVTNTDLTQYLEQTLRGEPQKPQCIQTGAIDLTVTTQTIAPAPEAPEPKRYAPRQGEKLPANYVPRPEPFAAVKTVLLKEATTTNTLVVSAILGLGGIGKSVLAAALAADPEIQQRFPDGTLWVTLGQNPDLLPMLGDWIQALGDYNYKPLTPEAASAHLRTLLYDRQMLLVVDDVWNPVHLDPFRVGGAGSCVLVTTREAKITDAQKYDLNVMTHDQAMELLTSKFGTALTEEEAQQAGAFAKRVGYLPLALELATAQIEEGLTWKELLNDFRQEVDRLETLDVLGKEDLPDDAERRKYSLLACFNLSLQRLTPEQQACFAWLGVLPEDADITQQMGKTLWQLTERQAGGVLKTFRGKALLKGERPTYRLHDLMHDLARQLLTSPTVPEKVGSLVGLGVTEPEAHGQLLARYRQQTEAGQWHTLPDDGHIYTYLTWHMLQAEVPQQIHELLQETTEAGRNGWYEACDAIGKPALFASDVGRGWQLAPVDNNNLARAIPLRVRYAFIRASLNSLASNIPAPMVGSLLKAKKWQPAQALAYAQQTQDSKRRSEYLEGLAPYATLSLWPEVLNTLKQISGEFVRAGVLRAIAEHIPEQYWEEALDITCQINDESARAEALSGLAQHLPELWEEALDIARQINDESARAEALSDLAQHLPELWEEVLDITRQIDDEYTQSWLLSDLAQYLPKNLCAEALDIIRQIDDESAQARALSGLAQHLPELWEEVLDVTCRIDNESSRSLALGDIAQHLPKHLWEEALDITRRINSEFNQARALSSLAQHLPELWEEVLDITRQINDEFRPLALGDIAQHLPKHLWEEALDITRQINDESARARVLSDLAQHLPELWEEVLDITRQINDESAQARVLSDLAQHLPELWEEVLDIARQINDEPYQVSVLMDIAQHLPEHLWAGALDITRQINDEFHRARVLSVIAQHLPELWEEVLDITRRINDELGRSFMLSVIAQHFPELWEEVLDVIRQINDEFDRAKALSAIAQHLPEHLWEEILDVTRQTNNEFYRAVVLIDIAQYLPELWGEVLSITRQINNEFYRARVLSDLAQHLPEHLWEEILDITRQINNEFYRAVVLIDIAQYLPELWEEVLDITRQVDDAFDRVKVLSVIAQHLPELWEEVLDITRQVDDAFRPLVLSNIAQHLPEQLWEKALDITCQIDLEAIRAFALGDISQHLPEHLWEKILDVTCQISNESDRANAISAITQHIPEQLREEALRIIWQIKDNYYRATALQGMLPRLCQQPMAFDSWSTILDLLAHHERKQLVQDFAKLRVPIQTLGTEKAFLDSLQAIREVCNQWP